MGSLHTEGDLRPWLLTEVGLVYEQVEMTVYVDGQPQTWSWNVARNQR